MIAARSDIPHIDAATLAIQLPCTEDLFSAGEYVVTEHLSGETRESSRTMGNMDESAYLIRLSAIRLRVLRYCRGRADVPPWSPGSEYTVLQDDLNRFSDNLPSELAFSSTAVFRKKRAGRLVAFLTLHVFLRLLCCDIQQVDAVIKRLPNRVPPPQGFLDQCRLKRLANALKLCDIIAEALPHEGIVMDPFMGTCAFQACKMLLFQRKLDQDEVSSGVTQEAVTASIDTAIRCLRRLSAGSAVCKQYVGFSVASVDC